MAQGELITGHIDQLMTEAARQGEWAIDAHREFLSGIGIAVRETLGISIDFRLPQSVLIDRPHSLPSDIPCSAEITAFGHAIELDDDPETVADMALIARARKICSSCIVKDKCLENAESSPILEPGMFGGKTMEERRPNWQKRLEERPVLLGALYKEVGQQIVSLAQKTNAHNSLITELETLREVYFPVFDYAPKGRLKVLSKIVYQALADPQIVERAGMLLPGNGRKVLERWAAAVEVGQDPLRYAAELRIKNLNVAEHAVNKLLGRLHNGTFDYAAWVRSQSSSRVPRSALIFLILVGGNIPEGDESAHRRIAHEQLSVLDSYRPKRGPRKDTATTKAILIDYYGLNGKVLDMHELSVRYNVTPRAIHTRIYKGMALLRTLQRPE